jgi:Fe2+ or Zn2+ uptake regulation protein
MNFRDVKSSYVRLLILQALEADRGYSQNESIIHSVLAELGQKCSHDVVRAQLCWLQEQGLVTIKDVSGIYVATITQRGADTAAGDSDVPGVKRPAPPRDDTGWLEH